MWDALTVSQTDRGVAYLESMFKAPAPTDPEGW